MKQLLISQILTHIAVLKAIRKAGEPFCSLSDSELTAYLEKKTVHKLELINQELRMRRFAYNDLLSISPGIIERLSEQAMGR